MKLLLLLLLLAFRAHATSGVSLDRCPAGLPSTSTVELFRGTCYQFVSDERYWTGARDYCIQYGGRLVKVGDAETNEFIKSTLNGLWWRNRGVWIGLHDEHVELQWQWTGTTRYADEPAGWYNWASGHPAAFMHRLRDCVRMVRGDGQWLWHETPCTALRWKYRFVCQYDPGIRSALPFGIVQSGSKFGQPDSLDHRAGRLVSTDPSTTASTAERTVHSTTTDRYENDEFRFEYVLGKDEEREPATSGARLSTNWVFTSLCLLASCLVLLVAVILWRRRADRRLRLVAVAVDDKPTKRDAHPMSSVSCSRDQLNLLLSDAGSKQHASSNHYEPEPRSFKVAAPRGKDLEEAVSTAAQYCPMNRGSADSRPRADRPESAYLAMGLPPDYESCITFDPKVSYANAEGRGDTRDCGVMGYDVPPVAGNVYSEIPDDAGIFDEDGNHIYEPLNEAKPQ